MQKFTDQIQFQDHTQSSQKIILESKIQNPNPSINSKVQCRNNREQTYRNKGQAEDGKTRRWSETNTDHSNTKDQAEEKVQ